MKSSAVLLVGVSLLVSAALAGCAPAETEAPETFVSDSDEAAPSPAATANVVEPDALLLVRATAVANNGAELLLEMQVHSSTPWDDIANQTLPAAMAQDCPGELDSRLFETDRWSFTRVNVSALPSTTSSVTWPEATPIWVGPSADFVNTVGRGTLQAESFDGESPCSMDKFVPGVGNGAFAIGIPGDAHGGADQLTGWAAHQFGFTAGDSGLTLTSCSFELTPLGASLQGDAGAWASTVSDDSCMTGAANEAIDR